MFQSKCPQLILQRKHFPCGCNLPTTRQAKRSAPALLSSIIKILNPLALGVLPPSFKTPSTQVSLGRSLFPSNSYRLFSFLDDHLPQGSLLLFPSSLRSGQPGHSGQAASSSNSPRETETDHHIYHELILRIAPPQLQSVTLLFLVLLSKVKKYRHPSCLLGPKLPTHWPTAPPQGAFQGNSSKAAHLLSYLSCSFLHRFCFVFS